MLPRISTLIFKMIETIDDLIQLQIYIFYLFIMKQNNNNRKYIFLMATKTFFSQDIFFNTSSNNFIMLICSITNKGSHNLFLHPSKKEFKASALQTQLLDNHIIFKLFGH